MRPARNAFRPADTASHMASAITTASCASAIAVFIKTPSAPNSIATGSIRSRADARIHDHRHFGDTLTQYAQVRVVLNPHAGADGRAKGHHGRRARIDQLARDHQVIIRVRQHDETLFHQDLRRAYESSVSGNKVCWSPITSSFTQFDRPTSLPSRAVRMASSAE